MFKIDVNVPQHEQIVGVRTTENRGFTPEELAELVEYVKLAEKILGTAEKKLQTEEEGMFKFSRKSVFAQKQIRKDEEFSEDNLCLLRPGTGIPANKFYSLLGKKSLRDIEALEMLSAQDVEK